MYGYRRRLVGLAAALLWESAAERRIASAKTPLLAVNKKGPGLSFLGALLQA